MCETVVADDFIQTAIRGMLLCVRHGTVYEAREETADVICSVLKF